MNRISSAFGKGHKALIAFVTCGDPDLETTAEIVRTMVAKGADLIELGIPFSDPVAEGPVILEASMRALRGGVTVDKIFDMVMELRKDIDVPIVFMTYANVVYARGIRTFATLCADAGVDGIILPDLPYEEMDEFEPEFKACGVDLISMISPASGSDRIAMIAGRASGFIYVVSSYGVTGIREGVSSYLERMIGAVRANSSLPCAVGFGISTPQMASGMAEFADGVIIGSAIMKIVAENGQNCVPLIGEFIEQIRDSLYHSR